ncbi:restriction endonuclease (plasmid) [Alkalihalobacillus hwajinpoensis]|uniref:restriction endonuclease n=1 Tax=Guptibacillus hwajinpoensis TaxID=208199 RepID=UPI0018839D73|nr:restriction endonuclease [Pseudalkalibacillus hwajinpoensis]MBF0706786.1 restriction endonuclease [Pseudalkalibacillus hwajinpoensis]
MTTKVIKFVKTLNKETIIIGASVTYVIIILYGKQITKALLLTVLLLLLIKVAKKLYYFHFKKHTLTTDINDIDTMTGIEFEDYLADFFETKGYNIKLTPRSGDYGVDLILRKRRNKIAVQVKCYTSNIGVDAIQEVIAGRIYWRTKEAMVITNRYFTHNAKKLAKTSDVKLVDRDSLIKLIR